MTNRESGPWTDADLIHSYTRRQALEEGVLVDVSAFAREAGFNVPVALTAAVHVFLTPTDAERRDGQSFNGRLWDVLMMLRANARDTDTVTFDVLIALSGKTKPVRLKAVIGPGDTADPVVTIMLPFED